MPDARTDQTWGTSQLVEFLAVLSGQLDEANAMRAAVERVLESLDAEIGVLLDADCAPVVVVGLQADDKRLLRLIGIGLEVDRGSTVEGLGECRTACAALAAGADSYRLLVARLGVEDFLPRELLLLRGMAWVLDLTRRQFKVLSELNERQRVLEQLSRVQRHIAAREPLPEVFDAVTQSALSLVGSEYALLHLFDHVGPSAVSVSGVAEQLRTEPWLNQFSGAVAEAVCRRDQPVHSPDSCDGFAGGNRSALGAPVRENGEAVGALVVISPPHGGAFAPAQEQALITFADQVSVALSDARTQLAAQHAVRDAVTGLPNRVFFLDQLESALAAGNRVHVLFLDLDRFKHVNDTLGHAVGDELLRRVGRRLRETLRGGERLARFGGDEFAVLLHNETDDGVRRCAERLLAAMSRPYQIGSEQITVGSSIGVAAAVEGSSAAEVLRNADTAMYRAKHTGGGQLVTFDLARHTVLRHQSAEAELRHAMGTEALRVAFQPIMGLRDGTLHAVEALARWDHPTRGLVPPADFIPLAEETGLIIPLGRQVLSISCAQAAAWSEVVEDGPGPSVSVNISARQLHDPGFLADVRGVLADTRLDADRLILEVTEGTMAGDLDGVLEVMLRLRELGVRLAIDDFGTGYSSLSYLRMFPVEFLKVDTSFVESVAPPWQGREFVEAIVRLAHALSMTPVAEGVETEEQVEALIEVGCEIGQGFLLARPMSSADIVTFASADPALRRWGHRVAQLDAHLATER
jgi:diguanylate cyclase (GGDEF)-like protein